MMYNAEPVEQLLPYEAFGMVSTEETLAFGNVATHDECATVICRTF